jgi:hypothetical protein
MECIECLIACIAELGLSIYFLSKILKGDYYQNRNRKDSFDGSDIFLFIVAIIVSLSERMISQSSSI